MHGVLEILSYAELGSCPTEPLCTLNKLSGKHVRREGAPYGRGDAVRSIPYPGPDYFNCRKSYCRHMAGRELCSWPPQPELAVTMHPVEFLALCQANLDKSSPCTTPAAMGGPRPTLSSPERVYNNSLVHVLKAIGEPTFLTSTHLAILIALVDSRSHNLW
jgi:hypothetical protein